MLIILQTQCSAVWTPLEITLVDKKTPSTLLLPLLRHIESKCPNSLPCSPWDNKPVTLSSFMFLHRSSPDSSHFMLIGPKQREGLDPCWEAVQCSAGKHWNDPWEILVPALPTGAGSVVVLYLCKRRSVHWLEFGDSGNYSSLSPLIRGAYVPSPPKGSWDHR